MKKTLAFTLAAVTALGAFTNTEIMFAEKSVVSAENSEAEANKDAIASTEDELEALEKKQKELDEKISKTKDDINSEEENKKAVSEQIETVQKTLHTLAKSINELEADITETEQSIAMLETVVEEKKQEIVEGVDGLKKRLRVMYIAGNDTYTDILVGASDFYDMLMKLELVKRVANHDNDMIDGLIELKEQYEAQAEELSSEKAELEDKLKTLEDRRKKQKLQMTKLEELLVESQDVIDKLELDRQLYENNKEQIAKEEEEFEEQLQELFKEQERLKKEEEARKKKEEEERKKKEEEERKKKEEEEKKKQEEEEKKQQQEQQDSSSQDDSSSSGGDNSNSGGNSSDDSSSTDSSDDSSSGDNGNNNDDNNSGGGNSNTDEDYNPNKDYGYVDKSRFTWPVPGFYNISYGVGWRWGAYHKGIDIWSPGIDGADIIAADAGTVILVSNTCPHDYGKNYSCGCGGGYGNYCIIDHGDGYWTLYGHSKGIKVSQGQYVKKGTVLGPIGSTGHSTGPHLHFEVRLNGVAQDPQNYV